MLSVTAMLIDVSVYVLWCSQNFKKPPSKHKHHAAQCQPDVTIHDSTVADLSTSTQVQPTTPTMESDVVMRHGDGDSTVAVPSTPAQVVPVKELESRSIFGKDLDSDKVGIKSVCCSFTARMLTQTWSRQQRLVGAEPKLVVNDGRLECVFICGDGRTICHMSNLTDAVLALIALYFTINLEYPNEYSQLLGLIQLMCMGLEFPPSLHSSAFTCLKESL